MTIAWGASWGKAWGSAWGAPAPLVIDVSGGWWRKDYRRMWERLQKQPGIKKIVREIVKPKPIKALEIVRKEVEQRFELPESPAELAQEIRENEALQRFIAETLLRAAQLKVETEKRREAEAILLLI